jgi:hypothetical protein
LLATLLTASATGACWSYAEATGVALGLDHRQVGISVAVSLLFQVIGSFGVALIGYRLPFKIALPLGVALQAVPLLAALIYPGFVCFLIAIAIFGFLWVGTLPFATELIISMDESKTAAPLVMPLFIIGMSMGPLIASFFVTRDIFSPFKIAIILFVATGLFYQAIFGSIRQQRSFPA